MLLLVLKGIYHYVLDIFIYFFQGAKTKRKANGLGTDFTFADGEQLSFGAVGEIAGCTSVCDGHAARPKRKRDEVFQQLVPQLSPLVFLLGGFKPKIDNKESWYPYSNLSAGGPSLYI